MILGDTIVAAATPYGYSGVAVLRLSGPSSSKLLFSLAGYSNFKNRRATLIKVRDGAGEILDTGLATLFKSPNSYTGEDLVEISTHGNPFVVSGVIDLLISMGARQAEPGEFTYRAFVNGKIDLVQAEAVAALINSKSKESAKNQQRIVDGELSSDLNEIRGGLVDVLSALEHTMDISEEEVEGVFLDGLLKSLSAYIKKTESLLGSFETGRLLNRGVSVVIVGPPNVGKSSLFNLIARTDRAIVSDVPGTTRDIVDVELVLSGVPVKFYDTAGVRKTDDVVEREGVGRAIQKRRSSDIVISVFDSPKKLPANYVAPKGTITVLNKQDLHRKKQIEGVIHISCLKKTGLDLLLKEIEKEIGVKKISSNTTYLFTSRQHSALSSCVQFLLAAKDLMSEPPVDIEIVSFEVREAVDALGTLLGKTTADDIINNIFKNLCVGK